MISAYCSQCGHQYQVKDQHAGRTLRCKKCQGDVHVPVPSGAVDDLSNLDLSGFDDVSVPEAPPPRRRKARAERRDRSVSAVIPISIVVLGLLVLINAGMRILGAMLEETSFGLLAWQLTLAVLVLVGVWLRLRLAWQYAKFVSAIAAILLFFWLVAQVLSGALDLGLFFAVILPLATHLGIIAALERPSAREWFGLNCPECGSDRAGAADFLFRVVRCKDCSATW